MTATSGGASGWEFNDQDLRGIKSVQVRLGLEASEAGTYQRQVGYMRLLGELYAYRIADSRCGYIASTY